MSHGSDGPKETVIYGKRGKPDEFTIDGPYTVEKSLGTVVKLSTRQDFRATRLVDSNVVLPLTARLAATLLALPEASVTYRDTALDPRSHVSREIDLPLEVDSGALHGKAAPQLKIVEWSDDMRSKTLFLCDDQGAVISDQRPVRLPPAPVHWSAYLLWEGFGDPELMGQADLFVPEVRHGALLTAAQEALSAYRGEPCYWTGRQGEALVASSLAGGHQS